MPTKHRGPIGLALAAFALLAGGYLLGQSAAPSPIAAQQPAKGGVVQAAASIPIADAKRVVAYVYGNIPITREEFGEYLISLYGEERLPLFVNKRLIEMACAKRGIDVTPIEIDAAIDDDCKRVNISKADWIRTVLKTRYNKTIDEWRVDVMKPRLLLAKLCRDQIPVADEELKQMYENRFGEKARVKIILWPKDQREMAYKMYGELRKPGTETNPDAGWDAVATRQPDATLAARAGEIEPIGRHSGSESARVEEIAFSLKVGDVSPIQELPIGYLVIKRVGTIPPVQGIDFEKVKGDLHREVIERKLNVEIPKLFNQIKEEAKPMLLMGKTQLPTPDAPPK
jgi:hypothetical protein